MSPLRLRFFPAFFRFPAVVSLLLAAAASGDVLITEFMARNTSTLVDDNGVHSDWIEIYNSGPAGVDLADWSLTDDPADLTKWTFPQVTLAPGSHLIVFASDENRAVAGFPLHTNFRLDAAAGAFLALVRPDQSIASQFATTTPAQFPDISFGLAAQTPILTPIVPGAAGKFIVPADGGLGTSWTSDEFSDSGWTSATTGVGYDTGGGEAGDAYADSVSADGPAGYWRLDDLPGTVAENASVLGSSSNGVVIGGAVAGVSGPRPPAFAGFDALNAARHFDGIDDRIDVTFSPGLNTTGFTVECWAKVTGGTGYRSPVANRDDNPQRGFIIYCTPANTWEFWTGSGASIGWNMLSGGTVTSNQWYHLVGTYDAATQSKKFYVDGVLRAQNTSAYGVNTANPFRIGASANEGPGQFFFNGDIDEVAVFDRALDAAEISERHAIGVTGVGPGGTPYADLIETDLGAAMNGVNASVFLRLPFSVADAGLVSRMTLRMKFDDGFQAWLNGTPMAAANAPLSPAWDSAATDRQPTYEALAYESFDLTGHLDALKSGTNVLAIQGLNLAADNPDLLLVPELELRSATVYSPQAWHYFVQSTPGDANGTGASDLGPLITGAFHLPALPATTDDIVVICHVENAVASVASVTLNWRVMFGAVAQSAMFDDGVHGDGGPDDDTYAATIPKAAFAAGNMVRWYFTATDTAGRSSRWPLFHDPLNSPEYFGTMIANPSVTTALPIWHWFAQSPSAANTRAGTRGAVFLNGELYDNAFIRRRGGATSSNSRKYDFNSGFHALIDPVVGRVEEANLNGSGTDPTLIRPPLAFETFRLAGHPSLAAFPMLMRVNGGPDSSGGNGGVAYFVEQPDERWLDRMGMARRGVLYKFDQRSDLNPAFTDTTNGVEKKTRLSEDRSDLQAVVTALAPATPAANRQAFMFDHFDLANMSNYLACRAVGNDYDDVRKNWYFYRDTEGKREWMLLPWDKDGTWGIAGDAGSWWPHPLYGDLAHLKANANQYSRLWDALFTNARTRAMYLRRLRTVMDEQLQPAPGALETRIAAWWEPVAPHRPGLTPAALTNWLPTRRSQLFTTYTAPNSVIAGDQIPPAQDPDVIVAIGQIEFNPSSGNQREEFVEIINPNNVAVDVSGWTIEGGIDHRFKGGTVILANDHMYLANDAVAFRARASGPRGGQNLFVQGNFDGTLSARGESFTLKDASGRLVATGSFPPAPTPAQQSLRITELMFNPPPGGGFESREYEFLEFENIGSTPLDLTGAHFTDGITFTFGNTVVPAGGRIVLARNLAAFAERYGTGIIPVGSYRGALDNSGERIRLADGAGEEILDFRFEGLWFPLVSGVGNSLVIADPAAPWETWRDQSSWRASSAALGSPTSADPLPPAARIASVEGSTVRFTGEPGRSYRIQRSPDLALWTEESFVVAGIDGSFGWTAGDAAPRSFVRAVTH